MKQISVVSKNRPGVVAEISKTLADQSINIESLASEAVDDHAVIILTVDRYDEALKALRQLPDMHAVTEDAFLVKIEDRPGALAELAMRFKNAEISLRSLRFIERSGGHGLVAISVDDAEKARPLIEDLLITG